MTDNRNPEAAWTYHDATKHSYTSIRTNPHFMDWSNQPLPFKIYPTLDPLRLPAEVRQTGVAALSAIAESVPSHANASPDLEAVAQLLYLSAGITRKRSYSGGEIYFRAAACTGALYEVELYLVCGGVANLEAGVYHFAPAASCSKPQATNPPLLMPHLVSFAPAPTGATPGNIRLAPTAISAGTTALSSPTCSPSPPPSVCLPAWCAGSWTPASIACWTSILSVKWLSRSLPSATSRLSRRQLLRKFLRLASKPSRSLSARRTIPSCEKCTPLLRLIPPRKWRRGAATRR